MHQTLIRLAKRAVALTKVADELEAQIAAIVEDLAPGLVAASTASARSPQHRSYCPGHTSGGSAPRQPSPCSRAPPPSRCPPDGPTGRSAAVSSSYLARHLYRILSAASGPHPVKA